MKRLAIICVTLSAMLAAVSCGGNSNKNSNNSAQTEQGVKFAPRERTSSMSAAERQAAIAAKKASLQVNVQSLMNSAGVKLSVLPPVPAGEITEAISEKIGVKMLGIIAANGVGGVNNVPGFAMGAAMTETGRQTTGTAPQKCVIKYDVVYSVLNVVDGNVYASATESVTGVGNTFAEAVGNAVKEIKSTESLQSMLATASDRIVAWYRDNLPTLKSQVNEAVNAGNYPLALAYLGSVPSQAAEAYEYATAEHAVVLKKYKATNAASAFSALKRAIAAGAQSTELQSEVYTALAMIPDDAPEYAQASKLVAEYESSVLARQAKAEAREIAAAEAQRLHEQQMAQAELEANKAIAIAEAKASEQAMRKHMREQDDSKRGFWGNLGARIINGIDYVGDQIPD